MIGLRARGTSMYPSIREVDTLLAEEVAVEKLYPGDIVLYESGGKIFAHRLIWKFRNAYLMKADTHFYFEKIDKSQIKGKVKAVVRNGWITDLSAPLNRIYSILLGVCLFPISFVYNFVARGFIPRLAETRPLQSDN